MFYYYDMDFRNLLQDIINNGVMVHNDRTGRDCLTIPSATLHYNTKKEYAPLSFMKRSFPVAATAEIIGYLRRYEWATQFADIGTNTWFTNANETEAWLKNPNRLGENHLGKVYGAALDDHELPELFDKLERHYDDRGLAIDFWRPEKFHLGCLRPCMFRHQFTILGDTLHLTSTQRSCDSALGLNFNSIQPFVLLKLFARCAGLKAGEVTHNITNVHIYDTHIDKVKQMLDVESKTLAAVYNVDKVTPQIEIADWVQSFDDIVNSDRHARDYIVVSGYPSSDIPKIDFDLVA